MRYKRTLNSLPRCRPHFNKIYTNTIKRTRCRKRKLSTALHQLLSSRSSMQQQSTTSAAAATASVTSYYWRATTTRTEDRAETNVQYITTHNNWSTFYSIFFSSVLCLFSMRLCVTETYTYTAKLLRLNLLRLNSFLFVCSSLSFLQYMHSVCVYNVCTFSFQYPLAQQKICFHECFAIFSYFTYFGSRLFDDKW